jgi:hypothetical protein
MIKNVHENTSLSIDDDRISWFYNEDLERRWKNDHNDNGDDVDRCRFVMIITFVMVQHPMKIT